jgi:uncharacterized glyoxalase superfamily protein PhnB
MTDDLDRLRRLRPDEILPADPPDPEVLSAERTRLLTNITGVPSKGSVRLPSIYPRLAYRDERAALEFLVRVFGLVERREARQDHPDGMLAWLELGSGVVMIGRAGPQRHGLVSPADAVAPTAMVNAYVDDVDAHHQRAVREGARVLNEPEDMLWGDRRYEVLDLDGHRWHFAERRPPEPTEGSWPTDPDPWRTPCA